MTMLALTITKEEFDAALARYPTAIESLSAIRSGSSGAGSEGDTLNTLDTWRTTELPALLSSRADPYLTKPELQKLLSCKLLRGKSRPTLPKLLASNTEANVTDETVAALEPLDPNKEIDIKTIMEAMKQLTTLNGVGPAMASFVLAAWLPKQVGVFSDEAFRWIRFEEGSGKGWDRKIQYTEKDFKAYVEGLSEVVKRLDVTAEEVEKIGFVFGREAAEENDKKATPVKRKREVKSKEAPNGEEKSKPKAKTTTNGKTKDKEDPEHNEETDNDGTSAAEENKEVKEKQPSTRGRKKQRVTETKGAETKAKATKSKVKRAARGALPTTRVLRSSKN